MAEPAPGARSRDVFLVANSPDEVGGVTQWTHRTARQLAARGHRVRVVGIAPAPPGRRADLGRPPYPVAQLHRSAPPDRTGGPRSWIDPVRQGRRVVRAGWVRRGGSRLSRLLRTARPGGVVIVTQVWAMEWVAAADTRGLTVIGMSHESYAATRGTSRFRRVRRYYADVDRLVVLTQEDADRWAAEAGLTHVDWLPNPLPHGPLDDLPEPSPRTARVVTALGRLGDEKGVDLLLESWARVAPRHPDWLLRIHGTGEAKDEEALRRQCAARGLTDRVEWPGHTADVGAALRAASVFVLPSRAEGFPLALMEAMAVGLPAAAFDCAPGVRELVRHDVSGLLAPPGDVRALARCLQALVSDPHLRERLGDTARAGMRRYLPATLTTRWEELFALLER